MNETNETTNQATNQAARQAARDAGRERAKLQAALGATRATRDAQKTRHESSLEGLKGKARTEKARELVRADREATLADLDGAQVTLTLSLSRNGDGEITNRARVEDVIVAKDVTGREIRLAVVGSLSVRDMIRVSVDQVVR